MTSTQPTYIKINLQLFLSTKDRCGSMKSCLPFLLGQIQCDDFLWIPQCLPYPHWSKQQDYCVSHQIPADASRTKRAVCTGCGLLWWRGPSVKMWTCGRVRECHKIFLMFPAWPSTLLGGSSLPHPDPHPPSLPCFAVSWDCVNVWWISSQENVENHILGRAWDWMTIHFHYLFYYRTDVLVAVVYYLQVWGCNTSVWCGSSEDCVQVWVIREDFDTNTRSIFNVLLLLSLFCLP